MHIKTIGKIHTKIVLTFIQGLEVLFFFVLEKFTVCLKI